MQALPQPHWSYVAGQQDAVEMPIGEDSSSFQSRQLISFQSICWDVLLGIQQSSTQGLQAPGVA
jgi:hypothetical protein